MTVRLTSLSHGGAAVASSPPAVLRQLVGSASPRLVAIGLVNPRHVKRTADARPGDKIILVWSTSIGPLSRCGKGTSGHCDERRFPNPAGLDRQSLERRL
jgi:hypothetical protein